METSLILKSIARHVSLSEEEARYFISKLEHRKVRAHRHLLEAGEVCRYAGFVTKGCLRAFALDKNGFEHIMSFATKGWWVTDMQSFLAERPATLTIEAMQDAELLLLSRKSQELLYAKSPHFERFFRIIAENSLVSYQQRLMDNLSLSANERYLKFSSMYPNLNDKLHQKHVAAYIGVTPEFLSKLKKGKRSGALVA